MALSFMPKSIIT